MLLYADNFASVWCNSRVTENETQNNVFMVKGIVRVLGQKYEPHYEACCSTVFFNERSKALVSVVNELFFHLTLKLNMHNRVGRFRTLNLESQNRIQPCSNQHERKFTTAKSHMLQSQRKIFWMAQQLKLLFLFITFTALMSM